VLSALEIAYVRTRKRTDTAARGGLDLPLTTGGRRFRLKRKRRRIDLLLGALERDERAIDLLAPHVSLLALRRRRTALQESGAVVRRTSASSR
jgi:hypothetical protein